MRVLSSVVAASVLAVFAVTVAAQSNHDGAMGVWVLNTQKSQFSPGPLPNKQTSTFTALPDGSVKIENDSTDAQGRTAHREMISRFDGKQEPRAGSPQPTTRAYRWISSLDFEFQETVNGNPTVTGRSSTSRDGRVRTLIVNGIRDGKPVHNVEVYERQAAAARRPPARPPADD